MKRAPRLGGGGEHRLELGSAARPMRPACLELGRGGAPGLERAAERSSSADVSSGWAPISSR